jgi:tRNA pseudouridine38-40 synthase
MIYALRIAYDGTGLAGWQRQANALSVQELLERALGEVAGEPVAVLGAGRTDAGVHARGQVASFRAPREIPLGALAPGLDYRLPAAVRVLAAARAAESFHARRSAAAKTYVYRCWPGRHAPPERARFVLPVRRDLDHRAIRAAVAQLAGEHDFAAFGRAGGVDGPTRRRLFAACWEPEGEEWRLAVTGEGFLRGMVRALAGFLLEIGARRRAPEELGAALAGAAAGSAGPTAPACGLTLERVDYPEALAPLW